jgi:dihydroorotate dehydrogenase (fumarate)
MILKISENGAGALVLFNRFFSPDIDIQRKQVTPTHVFSTQAEMSMSLKWIALSRKNVNCSLAASTGIHSGEDVIKQILAGADAVHIASVMYQKGFGVIREMLNEIEAYMQKNNYKELNNFKGLMSADKVKNHVLYERMQFMKYLSDKK